VVLIVRFIDTQPYKGKHPRRSINGYVVCPKTVAERGRRREENTVKKG
jgi:hypothetical protein